jgi:aminoglycoside phosphotransferase (APT) family kinase protein
MHADELDVDIPLVRRLLAAQFPQWADLPIEPVLPLGTDNANYRLGADLMARLPRRRRVVDPLRKERTWLSRLAPSLPLAIPMPVAMGQPGEGYPLEWAIYHWLKGEPATPERIADPRRAAIDLAAFIAALQRIDPAGGPPPDDYTARGVPLERRDAFTRASIDALRGQVDVDLVTALWEEALDAPAWPGPPVWLHGDLDARNILARNGRLSAVIDFGCLSVGDPAYDVMAAWKLFPADARQIFRSELAVDDATWIRSRGLALSQALGALAYYTMDTNPTLVLESRRWIAEVFADQASTFL